MAAKWCRTAPARRRSWQKNSWVATPFLLTYGDILVKPETYQQMMDRYRRKTNFPGS